MFQIFVKYSKWHKNAYSNIFPTNTHKNLPKIGIFGLKINHLATLRLSRFHPSPLGTRGLC
jgi:hypothetical protein